MIRVTVIVEGSTEEAFIGNVLAPAFWAREIYLTPIILGPAGHKGGQVNYARVRKDILLQLKQDRTTYCSTMFDLYGLGAGFPGTSAVATLTGVQKASAIEAAMRTDLIHINSELRADVRFIPYLQVHEFEGLLFSNPAAFAASIHQPELETQFARIRNGFTTPEDINDDPNTAPSKRIFQIYPPYRKVIDAETGAKSVGIGAMRQECPHFHDWLDRIESLIPLD